MTLDSDAPWNRWRELIAVGLVAGDMSPETISRVAGVSRLDVLEAFASARAFGIMDDGNRVPSQEATRLVADLAIDMASHVHAEMARHHLAMGRDGLERAVRHARAVTSGQDTAAVITLCDHNAELSLSLGDYRTARLLYEVAAELDLGGDDRRHAQRLLALAAAVDGEGDVLGARKLLQRASVLGERLGDVDLVVEAAVRHTLPTEWYAGDHHSLVMLQRTEMFTLSADQAVKVAAARGLAEMRIPVEPHDGQQLAWITRPEVAQPLTEWALGESQWLSLDTRAMALLAWRSTHRSPQYLEQRRAVSQELLALSQQLRRPALQVDAAVYLAVDALESADRRLYDKALGISRWVAEHDGSARLAWRADTLAAGAAHLDGDIDAAITVAQRAQASGQTVNTPGWFAAVMFFEAQVAISRDEADDMRHLLFDDTAPGMNNPLALTGIAYCFARCDDHVTANRYVRKALRQLDFEASALLLLSRASAVALMLDDVELRQELIELLTPWVDHVAVDSNAWWCDGPVSMWLALLYEAHGDVARARDLLPMATDSVAALGDTRSRRRLGALRRRLVTDPAPTGAPDLSERELQVLQLLSEGATNAQIGLTLSYSVSTVRNDTVSIYRKLNVSGRAEAVTRAHSLGLLRLDDAR